MKKRIISLVITISVLINLSACFKLKKTLYAINKDILKCNVCVLDNDVIIAIPENISAESFNNTYYDLFTNEVIRDVNITDLGSIVLFLNSIELDLIRSNRLNEKILNTIVLRINNILSDNDYIYLVREL